MLHLNSLDTVWPLCYGPEMLGTVDRHYGLDAFRGICAVLVCVYHLLTWSELAHLHALGKYGVYAFFLLSACTLTMVYGHRFSGSLSAADLRRFLWARIVRIMPLLVLVSALTAALLVAVGKVNPAEEVRHFLLTASGAFAFGGQGRVASAVGAWSLGIEALFYLVFPILALLTARISTRTFAWACAAVLVCQATYVEDVLAGAPLVEQWESYTTPLAFAAYFALGMLVPRIRLAPRAAHFWAGMVTVVGAVLALSALTTETAALVWPASIVVPLILFGALALVYASEVRGTVAAVGAYLGDISYSLYLLHPLAYQAAKRLGLGAWETVAAAALVSMVAATLSHRYFEMPVRNYLRHPRRSVHAPAE